jgi:chromosome segregation ATPase
LIALPFGAIILGVTIHFFLKSRRLLQQTLQANQKKAYSGPMIVEPTISYKPNDKANLQELLTKSQSVLKTVDEPEPSIVKPVIRKSPASDENVVKELKDTIAQQQKMLNSYLTHIEELEQESREELIQQNKDLQMDLERLEVIIERKDKELQEIKQHASMAQQMTERIEEVYREFELLQTKMSNLEKQANRANNLAIELEDTKQSYEQLYKDLMRKQEKLEEALADNQRLRKELETVEDKLAEANLQRQQLQRKAQFLQDLNSDMQTMSETNKKLQTELRRISELESMLNLMTEERDFLLRKQTSK